jgi:hypothetical protein
MKKHLLLSLLITATDSHSFHRDFFGFMQESMNRMEQHLQEMRQFFEQSSKVSSQPAERNEPHLTHPFDFNDNGLRVKIKNVSNKEIEAHFNDHTLSLQHPQFSASFLFNAKLNTLKTTIHVEQKDETESENQKSHMFFSSSQVESVRLPHDIDLEKTTIDYDENSQELTISFSYKQKQSLPINITRSKPAQ